MNPPPFILFSLCAILLTGCRLDTDLDQDIAAVYAERAGLPTLQPNLLCPTVGFGSDIVPIPDHTTWLDIILPETRPLDTLVLIPSLLKNKEGGLETLGFPQRFTIETWLDEIPGTQQAYLKNGGWLYQPIAIYDPAEHPADLICELALHQTLDGAGSAPVSVSLYHATTFEPVDGRDVHDAPGVTQIDQTQILPSWSVWSTTTGQQAPHCVSSRFDLRTVPAGATLFLRIANETPYAEVPVDDITLNPPFVLTNGDFEQPALKPEGHEPDIEGWYDETGKGAATHRGSLWSAAGYRSGCVVVDCSKSDFPNPGAAPVVFTLPPDTRAKKVRIRATRLQREMSWRKDHKGHNFSLNEVLLFDGDKNVALNSRTACADQENFPLMFSSKYAVDGYSYFPPIDPKEVSSPDFELIDNATGVSRLMFDLGRTCAPDEIRFYPVDRSPQFSHVYAMGVGFPRNITLRMSTKADPGSVPPPVHIHTEHQTGSHPLMHQLSPVSGRYAWIEMSEGQRDPRTEQDALGFSEIELLQNGTNLLNRILPNAQYTFKHLTDGLTSSGLIQPQKAWLLKLSRRAALEREMNDLLLQQARWHTKQRQLMSYLKTGLLVALFATMSSVWFIRSRHRKNLWQLRERIGANLHDGVGANLSSIALSAELLEHTAAIDNPQTRQLVDDITRVAQETATEIRLLSHLLEKQGAESNIIGQLRRIEQQMLPGLQTHAELNAAEQFNTLTPTDQWELLLFFKEALHNIVKHAHATRVDIRTYAEAQHLYLEITDNGCGLPDGQTSPVHLARRAKKLQAHFDVHSAKNAGTTIRLTIPKKRKFKKCPPPSRSASLKTTRTTCTHSNPPWLFWMGWSAAADTPPSKPSAMPSPPPPTASCWTSTCRACPDSMPCPN